uniref:Integrase catalytic domain-containing protein n=1 Tax=Rhodococcus sp. NS1 TaxID=402236 RepID=A0A097SPT5_9NOCA|nr:hypothetical protein LRS1606.100 [Rhodococcus sp. NS1]
MVHSAEGAVLFPKLVHTFSRHSMGCVGACGDNATMRSFFALLQKNVLDRRPWVTREELRIAIVTWIEHTYHLRRRQNRLGKLTPSNTRPSWPGIVYSGGVAWTGAHDRWLRQEVAP